MPARSSASSCGNLTWSPSFRCGPNHSSCTNVPPVSFLHQHLGSIVSAALAAVDARRVTERALGQLRDDFADRDDIRIVAAGKAAVGMATAAIELLGDRVAGGIITAAAADLGPLRTIEAGHPLPTRGSEQSGVAALAAAEESARDGAPLLVLLSGGASAMLAVPAAPLTIDDKAAATTAMLRAGLPIDQLNLVRRHLSAIKGGRLAVRAGRSITLAISDVCVPHDDDPLVIGSGPTIGDPSTAVEALAIVQSRGLENRMPPAVVRYLRARDDQSAATVRPGDPRLTAASFWIVASRADAMRAGAHIAQRLGYDTVVRAAPIVGEARTAAAAIVAETQGRRRPCCVIASGETTVTVGGDGRGGRNQELAVGALETLSAVAPAALASIGTDGVDGVTDAAGAIVDHTMWSELGASAGAICDDVLQRNDSFGLLDRLRALIRTGPTGTNVGDLQVLLLP